MTTQNPHLNEPDHPKAVIQQDRSFFITVTSIKLTAAPLQVKILYVGNAGNCLTGLEKQLQ